MSDFQSGQRVSAKWKGGSYYPGEITCKNDDGTYQIAFDDGCEEEAESAADIQLLSSPVSSSSSSSYGAAYSVGQRVEGRWKLSTEYFQGVITSVNDDGTYGVEFDDGCCESNQSADSLRTTTPLQSATVGSLSVGDPIKARFKGSAKLYMGKIVSVNTDATFGVLYSDGDSDPKAVSYTHLRAHET